MTYEVEFYNLIRNHLRNDLLLKTYLEDSSLDVHYYQAPDNEKTPYIVYSLRERRTSESDRLIISGSLVLMLYNTAEDAEKTLQAEERIIELLKDKYVNGVKLRACRLFHNLEDRTYTQKKDGVRAKYSIAIRISFEFRGVAVNRLTS